MPGCNKKLKQTYVCMTFLLIPGIKGLKYDKIAIFL